MYQKSRGVDTSVSETTRKYQLLYEWSLQMPIMPSGRYSVWVNNHSKNPDAWFHHFPVDKTWCGSDYVCCLMLTSCD